MSALAEKIQSYWGLVCLADLLMFQLAMQVYRPLLWLFNDFMIFVWRKLYEKTQNSWVVLALPTQITENTSASTAALPQINVYVTPFWFFVPGLVCHPVKKKKKKARWRGEITWIAVKGSISMAWLGPGCQKQHFPSTSSPVWLIRNGECGDLHFLY